nr:uncharacterized protein I206_05766 [Kwoniella pini CBS 10737]OCF47902.1 hypothetical protein I206_05766 [Kwoniella pini CBS 10737]
MLKIAEVLEIPTLITEQNPKALGATINEVTDLINPSRHLGTFSKTKFSMVNENTKALLEKDNHNMYIVTGIESHVCVLQTTLDLLKLSTKPDVYVLADGISSCNKPEIGISITRMEKAGAIVTTSESIIFELLGDANHDKFKKVAGIIKQTKAQTAEALESLCV